MNPTFVDSDGQPDWRKAGYHVRSAFAVLPLAVVLFDGGWLVAHKAREVWVSWRTESDYIDEGKGRMVVVIPEDAIVTQIGNVLVENGVIKPTRAFRSVVGRQTGPDSKLQAGRSRLRTGLPAETTLKVLLDPVSKVALKTTFPEGRVRVQQWEILTKELGLTGGQLTEAPKSSGLRLPSWAGGSDKLEGFLFPETYEMTEPVTAFRVLKQQVEQFGEATGVIGLESRTKDIGRSPYEVPVVASIIEKEAARAEDRLRIAQVVYNRLAKNLSLQFSSMVHYAIGQFDYVTTTEGDQATDPPYNTYKVRGLPPALISNPERSVIESTLVPNGENFLYFITVDLDTGETRYSTDEAGRAENVKLSQ